MKIALFAQKNELVFVSGLAEGFRQVGWEVNICFTHLPAVDLANYCRIAKPDAVFEVNRLYDEEPPVPRGVRHITWMQDHRYANELLVRRQSHSDLTYAILDPKIFGITARPGHHLDALMPGANLDLYYPADVKEQSVFSFIGYLPPPYPRHKTLLTRPDGTEVSIKQFIELLPPKLLLDTHFDINAIHKEVEALAIRLAGHVPATVANDMGLFDEIAVRTIERADLVRRAMAVASPIRLFSSDAWTYWPEFRSSYCGYLATPDLVREAYQSTRVNLHQGSLAVHYRTIDCMASGRLIMVKDTPYDQGVAGMRRFVNPGEHYLAFNDDNFEDVARNAIADASLRDRIGRAAHEAVRAAHTWRHRAEQVVRDLREL